jgi:hypothetical protein
MLTNKTSVTNTDFILTDLDVDADNNGGTAGDAKDDVFAGAATIHSIFLDASGATTSYLKLYDNPAPTIGTTDPDVILMVKEPCMWTILDGLAFTNLSYGASAEDGTGGTATPTVTVKLHMVVR